MSIVIIGGHDRMVRQYHDICKAYKCKAKVFTHMSADLNKQMGQPDLYVLFTNTVSHKMVKCAMDGAKKTNAAAMPMSLSCQATPVPMPNTSRSSAATAHRASTMTALSGMSMVSRSAQKTTMSADDATHPTATIPMPQP